MKRIPVFAAITIGLVIALAILVGLSSDHSVPRFQRVDASFRPPPYQSLFYEFLSPRPFEGGRMWVTTWAGPKTGRCYLYDIDHRAILGELFNASPSFMSADQTRLLCTRRISDKKPYSAFHHLKNLVKNVFRGKLDSNDRDVEVVYSLDLQGGRAKKLGSLFQLPGAGSGFFPSPSLRYAYNKPASYEDVDCYVCDLERKTLQHRSVDGSFSGWWSETEIVIKASDGNHYLYDVTTQQKKMFLSSSVVADTFRDLGITNSPGDASFFCSWNGHENDFYLTDLHQRWLSTNAYLFRVERPVPGLKLIDKDFKFEHLGQIRPGGTLYVFNGKEGVCRSGVYLRNLVSGTNLTLIEPDDNKAFSLPHFYHDTVIYERSNQLWQMSLTGSNRTRLFPPPQS